MPHLGPAPGMIVSIVSFNNFDCITVNIEWMKLNLLSAVSLKRPEYFPEMEIAGIERRNISKNTVSHYHRYLHQKKILVSQVQGCLKDFTYWTGLWDDT